MSKQTVEMIIPQGGGEEVWGPLREAGLLDSQESTTQPTAHGQEVAVAVSTRYEA